jgi:hypothetical protein
MPPFTLNLLQGSISFQIAPATIQNLQQEITVLMNNLKSIASRAASGGGKPTPQPAMEYRYS